MAIISNPNLGNFTVDGVSINLVPAPQIPAGAPTGLVAIVGGANDGPLNTPVPFTDAASAFAAFGSDTTSSHSLLREALSAMPEGTQFLGSRVGDGTQASATVVVKDVSVATVATFTSKTMGSNANSGSISVSLYSGTASVSPVIQVGLQYPNKPQETYNIVAYATLGSAYSSTTFLANLLAAVNVGTSKQAPSQYWTVTAGASTLIPVFSTTAAAGGVDGTATLTTASLIGSQATGTGLYALSGKVSGGQVIIAALTDATSASAMTAFAQQENCIIHLAFPSGTTTATAITTRAADALSNPSLLLDIDWDNVYDSNSGANMLVSPMGKIAGAIAAQPAYQYPGNQQVGGVIGVNGTERISGGISGLLAGEASLRQQNGLLYLGYMPRAPRGPALGLPHGMASDGTTLICDVRMLKQISYDLQVRLGAVVGTMMSSAPGPQFGNPAFQQARDIADAYFNQLLNGPPQQISAYQFNLSASNNSVTTVQQGFLIPQVLVTTLSAAQFIVAALQVGRTVQIQVQSA